MNETELRGWIENFVAGNPNATEAHIIRALRKAKGVGKEVPTVDLVREVIYARPFQNDPDRLLEILKEESTRRKKIQKTWTGISLAILSVTMGVPVILWLRGVQFDGSIVACWSSLSGVAAGASGRHKFAARAAAQLRDPRYLGPLLELYDCGDKSLVTVAKEAVLEILRGVDADTAVTLELRQLERLYRQMTTTKSADEAAAIAGALRYIGTASSIAPLENLAASAASIPAPHREKVRNLALMALGDLRIRLAKGVIDERLAATPSYAAMSEIVAESTPEASGVQA